MTRSCPASAIRERQLALRHLSVFVAVMCLLAQFSSALHLLVVSHVRCAEHAEWVADDAEHATLHAGAPGEARLGEAAVVATGHAEDHEHEHCLMCAERRNGTLPVSSLATLGAAIDDPAVVGPAARSLKSSAAIYVFAPKTSPPA